MAKIKKCGVKQPPLLPFLVCNRLLLNVTGVRKLDTHVASCMLDTHVGSRVYERGL